MLLRIVGIVFPIFIIVLLAFIYGRRHRPEMLAANRLNIEIFLPALMFSALSSKSFNIGDHLALGVGAVVVTLVSGLLCWPFAKALRYNARTLVPTAMFKNVGNMGMPLMLLAYGEPALGASVVFMLIVTLLQFGLSPWLINGRSRIGDIVREPFVVASVLGVAVSMSGITLWPPITAAVKILGDISLGLMIFSLGVRLSMAKLNAWGIGIAGAAITPVSGMLAAWGFGELAGISSTDMDYLLLFSALPSAVSNFILAERYGQEPDKVASIVMIGNASAIIFVPIALALRL